MLDALPLTAAADEEAALLRQRSKEQLAQFLDRINELGQILKQHKVQNLKHHSRMFVKQPSQN